MKGYPASFAIFAARALLIAGALVQAVTARAEDVRISLIVSGPPSSHSRAYRRMLALAAPLQPKPLALTGAEVWSIPAARVAVFRYVARRAGAKVESTGENAQRMLSPYSAGPTPSPAQQWLMARNLAVPSVVRGDMLQIPDDSAFEFALTSDSARLFSPLPGGISVAAKRTSLSRTASGYVWHGLTVGLEV